MTFLKINSDQLFMLFQQKKYYNKYTKWQKADFIVGNQTWQYYKLNEIYITEKINYNNFKILSIYK